MSGPTLPEAWPSVLPARRRLDAALWAEAARAVLRRA